MNITLENGKYTVTDEGASGLRSLRYGEEWRDLCGDGLVYSMASRIENLTASEKEISDAYLRIRTMLDAFDTAPGGTDRFEVTEKKLRSLMSFALHIHTLVCTCKTEHELATEVGIACYSEDLMLCDIARREYQILTS